MQTGLCILKLLCHHWVIRLSFDTFGQKELQEIIILIIVKCELYIVWDQEWIEQIIVVLFFLERWMETETVLRFEPKRLEVFYLSTFFSI